MKITILSICVVLAFIIGAGVSRETPLSAAGEDWLTIHKVPVINLHDPQRRRWYPEVE